MRWVAHMDSAAWGPGDEADLQAWLGQDRQRHGALLYAQALWVSLDNREEAPVRPALWPRRRVLVGSVAAMAVAAVSLGWFAQQGQSYSTRLGEIRRVPLPDGSVMMINSGSDLSVRLNKTARGVDLAQGEAWFEVAKDAQRPFTVSAGAVRARAVGTAFSVRRRAEGVEVLVTEGVVETWAEQRDMPRLRLSAGERALISATRVVHERGGQVDRALAWRGGMIDLSGARLADAAEEFNRYNTSQIVIADPQVAGLQIAGVFRIDDPLGFAIAMHAALGLGVETGTAHVIRIDKGVKPNST